MKRKIIIAIISVLAAILLTAIFPVKTDARVDIADVEKFLLSDPTDLNEYIPGKYVCRNFAIDVVHNASEAGFDANVFYVHFDDGTNNSHAIVVFHLNGRDIYADVTQADNWVYMNFPTGEYRSYSITTGRISCENKIDWYLMDEKED